MVNLATTGERILYARQRKGWSQTELANAIGVNTRVQISDWERGKSVPSLSSRKKVAEVLGVKPEWLMPDGGEALAAMDAPPTHVNMPKSIATYVGSIGSEILKGFIDSHPYRLTEEEHTIAAEAIFRLWMTRSARNQPITDDAIEAVIQTTLPMGTGWANVKG